LLNPVKINNPKAPNPRVLVAPLDWGLGHATRCIPIIKELLNQKCEVIIAAIGAQKAILQGEFPSLTFVELPGYDIIYDKNRALTMLRLIKAIPKILIRIKRERAWLGQFMTRMKPDLVISDNRYGLALPGVFCVFVTHQLRIRTSFGRLADALLQRMNYRLIGHFSRCWVPDTEAGEGLAGALSHPARMPGITTKYIGWLSRFGKISQQVEQVSRDPKGVDTADTDRQVDAPDLLILLSGPEPQRTLLEARIITQAGSGMPGRSYGHLCRIVLVRGLPVGGPALPHIPPGLTAYDHLPAAELESLMRKARLIVARSGYSTVMDLARLGKRALLIPTPGQSEQEYLGPFLAARGRAFCVKQSAFSLREALSLAGEGFTRAKVPGSGELPKVPGAEPVEPEGRLLATEIEAVLAMLAMEVQI
jgi:UDP-N-acetylglucosamine transferase subunit ALG13